MVRVTALDIQVSLRNPTAMLEDSMTSVKNALLDIEQFPLTHSERRPQNIYSQEEINLYCIIKLATEISLFLLQISKTWCLCRQNPYQSKKLPICT